MEQMVMSAAGIVTRDLRAEEPCAGLSILPFARILLGVHPEGMEALSPGLRGTSYPGVVEEIAPNPERVASSGPVSMRLQPFQG